MSAGNTTAVPKWGDVLGAMPGDMEWINLTDARAPIRSSVVGYRALLYNPLGVRNTVLGYDACYHPDSFAGDDNTVVGAYAGRKVAGGENTLLGSMAGLSVGTGRGNTAVGHRAAGASVGSTGAEGGEWGPASGNTLVGERAGGWGAAAEGLADSNTHVGCLAGPGPAGAPAGGGNTSLGAGSEAAGGDSVAVGHRASAWGGASVALGGGATASGDRSVVVGPGVACRASRCLLLHPAGRTGAEPTVDADETLDVFGVLRGAREPGGMYASLLESDRLTLASAAGGNRISMGPAGMDFQSDTSAVFLAPLLAARGCTFAGPRARFESGAELLGASRAESLEVGDLSITGSVRLANLHNALATGGLRVEGGLTACNGVFADAAVVDDLVVRRTIALPATRVAELDAASLRAASASALDLTAFRVDACSVAACSASVERLQASEARVGRLEVTAELSAPQGLALAGLRVTGGASFEGPAAFGGPAYFRAGVHVCCEPLVADTIEAQRASISNLTVPGVLDAADLRAALADVARLTAANATLAEASVDGLLRAGSLEAGAIFAPNATACNLSADVGSFRELHVSGNLFVSNFSSIQLNELSLFNARLTGTTFSEQLVVRGPLSVSGPAEFSGCVVWRHNKAFPDGSVTKWHACLREEGGRELTPDLVFSMNATAVFALSSDFDPGVLNFTGKHRCLLRPGDPVPETGTIVCCTGAFAGLDGARRPTIDESLPVVAACARRADPAAFGVVAGVEAPGPCRSFALGNARFVQPKADGPGVRLIVNSVGEGGMWVCDANGPVRTGDLITTSPHGGMGERQADDLVRSHTVAKCTGEPASWQPAAAPGGPRRAFAGVTYRF